MSIITIHIKSMQKHVDRVSGSVKLGERIKTRFSASLAKQVHVILNFHISR